MSPVYYFPVVAVSSYSRLQGLKQYKFITLQFCRSEVGYYFQCARIKFLARLFLLSALRDNSFACPSHLLEAAHMPCLLAHLHLQNQQQLVRSFLYHITQSLTLSPHSFTFKDPYYLLGALLFSESVLGAHYAQRLSLSLPAIPLTQVHYGNLTN